MNSFTITKKLAVATAAAFILSVSSGIVAATNINPFGMTDLSQSYQLAGKEGKCGEGKCGGSKPDASKGKSGEGKCGGGKDKATKENADKASSKGSVSKCGG